MHYFRKEFLWAVNNTCGNSEINTKHTICKITTTKILAQANWPEVEKNIQKGHRKPQLKPSVSTAHI